MTSGWSRMRMIRISPWHFGRVRGLLDSSEYLLCYYAVALFTIVAVAPQGKRERTSMSLENGINIDHGNTQEAHRAQNSSFHPEGDLGRPEVTRSTGEIDEMERAAPCVDAALRLQQDLTKQIHIRAFEIGQLLSFCEGFLLGPTLTFVSGCRVL